MRARLCPSRCLVRGGVAAASRRRLPGGSTPGGGVAAASRRRRRGFVAAALWRRRRGFVAAASSRRRRGFVAAASRQRLPGAASRRWRRRSDDSRRTTRHAIAATRRRASRAESRPAQAHVRDDRVAEVRRGKETRADRRRRADDFFEMSLRRRRGRRRDGPPGVPLVRVDARVRVRGPRGPERPSWRRGCPSRAPNAPKNISNTGLASPSSVQVPAALRAGACADPTRTRLSVQIEDAATRRRHPAAPVCAFQAPPKVDVAAAARAKERRQNFRRACSGTRPVHALQTTGEI